MTASRGVVDAVATAAEGLSVTPLEIALTWVRDRPGVTAPIVGAAHSGAVGARACDRGHRVTDGDQVGARRCLGDPDGLPGSGLEPALTFSPTLRWAEP